jgi:hypothetical protein
LIDIFKKFDLVITNSVDYKEFNDFYTVIGKQKIATELEFKTQILDSYNSTDKVLTLQGFKEWWQAEIKNVGEEPVWGYLEKLGYDRDLYSVRSRRFNITFHSKSIEGTEAVKVQVRDAIGTDIDKSVSQMILREFGKDVKRGDGYRIVEYTAP